MCACIHTVQPNRVPGSCAQRGPQCWRGSHLHRSPALHTHPGWHPGPEAWPPRDAPARPGGPAISGAPSAVARSSRWWVLPAIEHGAVRPLPCHAPMAVPSEAGATRAGVRPSLPVIPHPPPNPKPHPHHRSNIPLWKDDAWLQQTFARFGAILSAKVMLTRRTSDKPYGCLPPPPFHESLPSPPHPLPMAAHSRVPGFAWHWRFLPS